jgi:hypothetical protein
MSRPILLLHVGTTKTGTTTLQDAWNTARVSLLRHGILYPEVDLDSDRRSKHQWITNLLLVDDVPAFRRNVERVLDNARSAGAARVILSTEGIFNHWFDYSASARAAFAELRTQFDVKVWVFFREPVSWAISMYAQAVRNPPFHLAPVYATADPPEAIIDHPYFARRIRYADFVRDAETVFGQQSVVAMRYESGDVVEQARRYLGVGGNVLTSTGKQNVTLSKLGVDLLRRLNTLSTGDREREELAERIVDIDRALGRTSGRIEASPEFARKVLAISHESERYLATRFGISWAELRTGLVPE